MKKVNWKQLHKDEETIAAITIKLCAMFPVQINRLRKCVGENSFQRPLKEN